MARPLRILVVLIGLGALLLAPRAAAQEALAVEIAPTARLIQGGGPIVAMTAATAALIRRLLNPLVSIPSNCPMSVSNLGGGS